MMNYLTHFLNKWRNSTAMPACLIAFLIPATAILSPLWAADCTPLSIGLYTQADVDNFQANHGPCDRALTLYIEGTDINNLDGLSDITNIGSSLYIENNDVLSSMDGLSNLTSVDRNLWIQNNTQLTNLDGLSTLTGVGETLAILYNDALINVNGLSGVTSVGGTLGILENTVLTNVDGLSALTSVGGSEHSHERSLDIRGNDMLNQCTGLSHLVDQWDDAEPGPGPGGGGVPDVGGEVLLGDNHPGCNSIEEILATVDISKINPGLNDAWYYPETDGQGFFITIFPDLGVVSLAWFTYDTELPADDVQANLGDPGHRWLTALGPIDGNQVMMNIDIASGGIFDTTTDIQHTDPPGSDGTIKLTFNSCNSATVEYDIPSINRRGTVPIRRIADDNIVLCEALNAVRLN